MNQSIDTAIENLDLSIFKIESQTSPNDRRSLLALQKAVRKWKPGYAYFELGSHLGGSLVPHLLDPLCQTVVSVDKRPSVQPDERGIDCYYPSNSTQRMIDGLALHVSPEGLAKMRTYDMDASSLTAKEVATPPDLAFIDAEHTNEAVFRDFLAVFPLCGASAVYAFHDANLVISGLQNIEAFLRYMKIEFTSVVLRDCVFVLATNDARNVIDGFGTAFAIDKQEFAAKSYLGLMQAHRDVLNAQTAAPKPAVQTGNRNAPCPCGSGKRYKHCHGR